MFTPQGASEVCGQFPDGSFSSAYKQAAEPPLSHLHPARVPKERDLRVKVKRVASARYEGGSI